jgi:murein DD-endopeptidase MepM/ murein hydrolase activator NlpD
MSINFSLKAPLRSVLLTEGWGMTRSADTGGQRYHGGVDLRAPVGTPAYASSNGTVLFGGQYADGSGGAVELDHGDGMITRYLHLSRVDAGKGAKLRAGQQLGLTGYAVSPHLHNDSWVLQSKLGEYTRKFGTPIGLGSLTKTWNGQVYVKVPAEPLYPGQYQQDVIDAAKKFNVKLYSPLRDTRLLFAVLLLAGGGYAAYRYFKPISPGLSLP